MHRRRVPVVRPSAEKVTQVDEQRSRLGKHGVPRAVRVEDLEARDRIGPEHRDDAVVGVGAHPQLVHFELGSGFECVVDGAQDVDRVVGERLEEVVGEFERTREHRRHPSREPGCVSEPGVDPFAELGDGRGVWPDVAGVDVGIELGRQVREVVDRRADVERLEHVGGRVETQAVAEALRLRWRVPAVDGRARCAQGRLLVGRQREERVHRGTESVDHLLWDAVAGDLDEADVTACGIDPGGDRIAVRVVAGRPRADVDDGNGEVAHACTSASSSINMRRYSRQPMSAFVWTSARTSRWMFGSSMRSSIRRSS